MLEISALSLISSGKAYVQGRRAQEKSPTQVLMNRNSRRRGSGFAAIRARASETLDVYFFLSMSKFLNLSIVQLFLSSLAFAASTLILYKSYLYADEMRTG